MNGLKTGWFSELNPHWKGQAMSLEVDEILFQEKSKFQDVLVFKSKTYGNVLVLDDVIQCTDRDECSYQEMLAHLPLCCHPNPKKVLIIGGGDGGVAREAVKHPGVEMVVQCEIDEVVVNAAKKYLPNLSKGFDNPKVTLHIGDGFEFMKKHQQEFDVILTDSSDPEGPAESLFGKNYYELVKKALKPDGLLCSQGECIWLDLSLIQEMQDFCKTFFPVVEYATTFVPTYPCGQIGFILCSKNPDTNFKEPLLCYSEEQLKQREMKYYNSEVHRGAFALPQFVKEALR